MIGLDKITAPFKFPTEILSVEYHFGIDSQYYYLAHLQNKKGQLELVRSAAGHSLQELLQEFPKSLPVFILISGKKVLVKKVDTSDFKGEEDHLIAKAFPNISVKDLHFQVDVLGGTEGRVAAIRNDVLEEIVQHLQKFQLSIMDFSLGLFSLWPLLLKMDREDLHLGFHHLILNRYEVTHTDEDNQTSITVFDEEMPANEVCAYLNGVNYLATNRYRSSYSALIPNRKDWQYGRLFKTGITTSAALLFLILFASYMLFNHYSDQTAGLSNSTQAYDIQLKTVENLKTQYQEKKQFLEVNGQGNTEFSRMADQIASTLPKGVVLQEMYFFPLEKKLKKEKLVRFHRNRLELSGETDNYEYFRNWTESISKLDWAGDIKIIGYQEKNSKHQAEFKLNININIKE